MTDVDDAALIALRDAMIALVPDAPFILIVKGEVIGHVASLEDAKAAMLEALRGLEEQAELREVTP